jgi:hypothetical protein
LWKVSFDSEDLQGPYLAVIGGYPVNSKDLSITTNLSGYYSAKTLSEALAEDLFKRFIEIRDTEDEE